MSHRRGGVFPPSAPEREKHPFNDKQSQIAERKTVGEQGPGDHGKEAAEQKSPRLTPLTGREHVGGGNRGKSPDPTPGPCARSRW